MIATAVVVVALGGAPDAKELLGKYDAVMSPDSFKAVAAMTAHRDDGSTRSYKMTILKVGADKSRIWFLEPAAARGQEILRNGDNSWIYMPNLKRSLRLASRDSFQGGDFNNADVLRTNYAADYDCTVGEDAKRPDTWKLELKARTPEASYERITLWVARAPAGIPVRGEYFTASGKLLRSADFSDVKDFGGGYLRPAKVSMRNEVATQRFSELLFDTIETKVDVPATRFSQSDLGR